MKIWLGKILVPCRNILQTIIPSPNSFTSQDLPSVRKFCSIQLYMTRMEINVQMKHLTKLQTFQNALLLNDGQNVFGQLALSWPSFKHLVICARIFICSRRLRCSTYCLLASSVPLLEAKSVRTCYVFEIRAEKFIILR